LPSGGIVRFPDFKLMELVGQIPIQVAQEKQSGIVRSRLRIASITDDGHAFAQASQAMQVL
jgi:hypothetical protein